MKVVSTLLCPSVVISDRVSCSAASLILLALGSSVWGEYSMGLVGCLLLFRVVTVGSELEAGTEGVFISSFNSIKTVVLLSILEALLAFGESGLGIGDKSRSEGMFIA